MRSTLLALSLLTALGAIVALGAVLFDCFAEYTRKGACQRQVTVSTESSCVGCDYAHCVISGAKTDTNERFVQPNLVASQANKRLFRKAGDA
jgi:hypothetical protein